LIYSTLCFQFQYDSCEIFIFRDRSIHIYGCDSIERAKSIISSTVGL
jgi:hypothetical protein